jgi:hypothetical protein
MPRYVGRVPLDDAWVDLVDDAAIFPPGDVPFDEAVDAYDTRSEDDGAELVGSFVLRDTDLPQLRDPVAPVSIVCTGGAGQLAGPSDWVRRKNVAIAGMEIAVRDLDDPAGNVRRIVAATDELETEWPIFVELPQTPVDHGWLAAADVAAEAGLRLKFRTGGLDASAFPSSEVLAGWIDAALDRETEFKCTAGLHRAVRHTGDDGFEHHGFLNVLVATARAFAGSGLPEVTQVLESRDAGMLTQAHAYEGGAEARRWFWSFGSCSVAEPWADLRDLGLVT